MRISDWSSDVCSSDLHDLQLGRVAGDGTHEPVPPGDRLRVVPGAEQRLPREGGVAQPAVAVVPVADAAEHPRQPPGGRGHDATGRPLGEGLEGDVPPEGGVAPGPVGWAMLRTGRPPLAMYGA